MGTARAWVVGSGSYPACSARVLNPSGLSMSFMGIAPQYRRELFDYRVLPARSGVGRRLIAASTTPMNKQAQANQSP